MEILWQGGGEFQGVDGPRNDNGMEENVVSEESQEEKTGPWSTRMKRSVAS